MLPLFTSFYYHERYHVCITEDIGIVTCDRAKEKLAPLITFFDINVSDIVRECFNKELQA